MPFTRGAGLGLPDVAGNVVGPSENITVPVGVAEVPVEAEVTAAVSVTGVPTAAVGADELMFAVVG